jgi:hypothetical protein
MEEILKLKLRYFFHLRLAPAIFGLTFGNKTMMKFIIYYNLALFIIIPIFIFIILSGNTWVAPLISANEIVYKALFLSISVLVIKEGIERPGNQETMVR